MPSGDSNTSAPQVRRGAVRRLRGHCKLAVCPPLAAYQTEIPEKNAEVKLSVNGLT